MRGRATVLEFTQFYATCTECKWDSADYEIRLDATKEALYHNEECHS